jgi:hypothetical protein
MCQVQEITVLKGCLLTTFCCLANVEYNARASKIQKYNHGIEEKTVLMLFAGVRF